MIRDRLLGAWSLVSFESTLPDGRIVSPLGRGAHGFIAYTPDGHVSVNLSRERRIAEQPDTIFNARTDAAVAAVARAYMAYCGPFEVDEARAVARHHFDMCLDPALIGTLQERHVRFFEDKLELSVVDASEASGVGYPSVLVWRRLG